MSRQFISLFKLLDAYGIDPSRVAYRRAAEIDLDHLVRRSRIILPGVATPDLMTDTVGDILDRIGDLVELCRVDYDALCALPTTMPDPADWQDEHTFPVAPLDVAVAPWVKGLEDQRWSLLAAQARTRRGMPLLVLHASPAREFFRTV